MKTLILATMLAFLAGCANLEKTLGVQADDNAILCVEADASGIAGAIGGANAAGSRIEVPAGVDTSQWTVEDIVTLIEACD